MTSYPDYMIFLQCPLCAEKFPYSISKFHCKCGSLLDIQVTKGFKTDENKSGLWRYINQLPFNEGEEIISYGECFTPLEKTKINGREVWLKHDYLFPSGSYKDRGMAVMVNKIRNSGISSLIEDSSGNAGASLACYSAKTGLRCKILVPEKITLAKTRQMEAYGAEVIRVKGDRDQTAAEALKHSKSVYYASHVYNPLFYQGIKTLAFEICEQLSWNAPDKIVVPAGNGTLVIGLFLGFSELAQNSIINHIPKIIGVQAENCSPLTGVNREIKPTVAEGIAIGKPARKRQILWCISESKGKIMTVSEEEIENAKTQAWRMGYFIEATSAVVWAAFCREKNYFMDNEKIILILTGNGLKSAN